MNVTDPPAPLAPSDSGVTSEARPALPSRLWLWALVAGLAAGLVASAGGEAVYGRFEPVVVRPPDWDKISPFDKPDILSRIITQQKPATESKNAALAYGLMGASLGGAMGLAAGLARRSPKGALASAFVGAFAGSAVGAATSAALIPLFFRYLDPESSMILGLMIHAGIWGPIGAAAGMAFGMGLGGRRWLALAIVGGLAGAVLGTVAFEVANDLAFPNARLDKPIPMESGSRILGHFCVTIFTALGAALGVGERKPKITPAVIPSS